MKTCLILIDAQESFRQRSYFTAADLPAYLAAQNALIDGCVARGIPLFGSFMWMDLKSPATLFQSNPGLCNRWLNCMRLIRSPLFSRVVTARW
jgi:nicotinamidase-related amidase